MTETFVLSSLTFCFAAEIIYNERKYLFLRNCKFYSTTRNNHHYLICWFVVDDFSHSISLFWILVCKFSNLLTPSHTVEVRFAGCEMSSGVSSGLIVASHIYIHFPSATHNMQWACLGCHQVSIIWFAIQWKLIHCGQTSYCWHSPGYNDIIISIVVMML